MSSLLDRMVRKYPETIYLSQHALVQELRKSKKETQLLRIMVQFIGIVVLGFIVGLIAYLSQISLNSATSYIAFGTIIAIALIPLLQFIDKQIICSTCIKNLRAFNENEEIC